MKSAHVSASSAGALALGGVALLFGADDILPRVISGFPEAGVWLGQLLAGAWLGVAVLNWFNRGARMGGIYGKPIVMTNAVLYFVSAMALLKIITLPGTSMAVDVVAGLCVVFAALYAKLMFLGPFHADGG